MRLLLIASGLLLVAGCAASSAESAGDSTANIDEGRSDAGADASTSDASTDGGTNADASANASACLGAAGIDPTMTQLGIASGGEKVTDFIIGVTASTIAGTFTVTLPKSNASTASITRTLPSDDVTVSYTALVNPDDFVSPTVTFTATSGTVTCGALANGDYPCTFTDLVLTPQAGSDPAACASAAVPTFTLHVPVAGQ